jgi:conjugative transfer region protein (TIGR03748 family)
MKRKIILMLLISLGAKISFAQGVSNSIQGSASTVIGRYLGVTNQALPQQNDLLNQTFQIHFPLSIKTVGDAMNYLLQFSGYRLVSENMLIPEARQLMQLPLPQSDRVLGPLTLKDGLLVLAGKPFGLLVDPVHRLIAFRLLNSYEAIYQKPRVFHFSMLRA